MRHLAFLLGTLLFVLSFLSVPYISPAYGAVNTGVVNTGTEEISGAQLREMIEETGAYLIKAVPEPTLSSVGGEWTILGLIRGNLHVPDDYREGYVARIKQQLEEQKGILSRTKYTEYSRLILALTALGEDVTRIGGVNLLSYLVDLDQVTKQGVNGPAFALLALDSHGYGLPKEEAEEISAAGGTAATRENLVAYLLMRGPQKGDPDRTAMMLQALSPYGQDEEVARFGKEGFLLLEEMESADGQYYFGGEATSESLVQVMIAKQRWGVSWEKNFTALQKYRQEDGSYEHVLGEGGDLMATEQALYALVNVYRALTQSPDLYEMEEVSLKKGITVTLNGLLLSFDQDPVLEDSRVLVPLRGIFEALDANVSYEPETRQVHAGWEGHEMVLYIGAQTAWVDGKPVVLDVPAKIVNSRTLVPIRFVAESLKATVDWEASSRQVVIER
jgi:hypothetical protein